MFRIPWDVKEPTHYSKRVGHEVPCVVAVLCESIAGPHQLIAAKNTQPAQSNKRKKENQQQLNWSPFKPCCLQKGVSVIKDISPLCQPCLHFSYSDFRAGAIWTGLTSWSEDHNNFFKRTFFLSFFQLESVAETNRVLMDMTSPPKAKKKKKRKVGNSYTNGKWTILWVNCIEIGVLLTGVELSPEGLSTC